MVTHGQTTVGTTSMSESQELPKEPTAPTGEVAGKTEGVAAKDAAKPEIAATSAVPIEIKVASEPRIAAGAVEAPSRRRSLPPSVAQAAALACALAVGWAAGHA